MRNLSWKRSLLLLSLVLTILPARAANPTPKPEPTRGTKLDFIRDVKPILANNCFACHGPDPKTRKAKLRLDLREEAVKEAGSGERPIVPGKSAESELVRRLFEDDLYRMMPPSKSNKALKPSEKELLKRWIDEGAEYREHWAWVKPVRPAVPAVKDKGWVRNEIDAFVLQRLEQAGLKPAPEADRPTLLRRLSFDLRGLPPTLQEVDEFLNDQKPDAYERMVDRLLASPHYGEKMAQNWLDLARFGDTSGYHFDSTRQMWLWRNYIIDAFNKNKPYDQFTVEQLAGDLLPGATVEQKVASGFNRNTRFNEEGGADPEEFVIRYNVDRTNTLGQIWLGMTLGCAECHSHKYDPISHKEYYQLYAFFTGIKEPMVSMNHNQPLPPLLKVPTPEHEKAVAQAKKEIGQVEEQIAEKLKAVAYVEPTVVTAKPKEPVDVVWVEDDLPVGAVAQGDGTNPWQWGIRPGHRVLSGKRATKRSSPGLTQHYFTGAAHPLVVDAATDRLFAHVWLDPRNPPKAVMLQWNDGSWEHRAYWGEDACFLKGSPDGPNHRKIGPLPKTGEWVRLEVPPEVVGLKPGAKLNGLAFTQFDGTAFYDKAGIRSIPPDDRYRLSQLAWEQHDKGNATLPAEVREALQVEPAKRGDAQKATLRAYYLRHVYSGTRPVIDPLHQKIEELNAKLKKAEESLPTVMVSEEMAQPRPAFVLLRGDFQQRGEKVQPAIPAMFPPLPAGQPNNRLGLARWLVQPDHPLTARVTVNRLWGQMFGSGIVRTIGDFGTQGEYPSHPALLEYLATEFVATGWDTKALLRKLALSATYRQSSAFGAKVPDADPQNRWLYRAPRFRLSGEEIRDSALAVSGLLARKLGGPSVMPYQPEDFYKGKNESWSWKVSEGEDLYRRGLYTFWRRTSLHPMYALFDAPSREECLVFRPRTNTPLQALATLNDPTFVEAARVFAQRILAEGPADLDGKLTFAFRTTLTRRPNAGELQALKRRLQLLQERFRKEPQAAAALVTAGKYPPAKNLDPAEHAAWTGLANILLNLDETLTRE